TTTRPGPPKTAWPGARNTVLGDSPSPAELTTPVITSGTTVNASTHRMPAVTIARTTLPAGSRNSATMLAASSAPYADQVATNSHFTIRPAVDPAPDAESAGNRSGHTSPAWNSNRP